MAEAACGSGLRAPPPPPPAAAPAATPLATPLSASSPGAVEGRGHGRGQGGQACGDELRLEVAGSHSSAVWVRGLAERWRSRFAAAEARRRGGSEALEQELSLVCGVETLRCPAEALNCDPRSIPPHVELLTLRLRQQYLEKKQRLRPTGAPTNKRIQTMLREMELQYHAKQSEEPEDAIPPGEVLLDVNVYYPIILQRHKCSKPHQVLHVLGSQKLTELRDALPCVSDLQMLGEYSNTPDLAPEHTSRDLYKSAFFYFEGIFYNDMRFPECQDLSRTIVEWASCLDRGLGPFEARSMEDHTFNDLVLKVGFPYLYCHQGDCEHIIIVKDIRMVNPDDCQDRSLYPLLVSKHCFMSRKCLVCKIYTAKWVTNNDELAPEDPCFFCDVCFRMLHYDESGGKVCDFEAFPYVDPGIFN
ncbi:snRNA-activating protein complex subunit 3 [Petromyzon marinus]|uniref:snRNA-activating protein complex subunit 3 n=1 Tax=Petromyzon marinus TaxID=7757 RepID=UPI003F6EA5CF